MLRRIEDTRGSDSARNRLGGSKGSQLRILEKGSSQSGGEVSMKESGDAGVQS